MIEVQPFLTAFDPSDLPGMSVDPLGFDRGYTFLADKILPGLTNVANRPRYLSALCGALHVSESSFGQGGFETPQARMQRRLSAVQRLERFWTLGCMLASRDDEGFDPRGVRGVRYVEAALRRMDERGDTSTDGDFKLLSRQVTYGMVGIYGSVADGLRLIERESLGLGPDIGRRLGEAFIEELKMPPALRKAVAAGGTVELRALSKWASRAHLDGTSAPGEARALRDALELDVTRRRMANLLEQHKLGEEDTELGRLQRICHALSATGHDPDLREALRAIHAFEDGFRSVVLTFFRLLWFCQAEQPYAVELERAAADPVIAGVVERVRNASGLLDAALAEAETVAFRENIERLADVQGFLREAASAPGPRELVECVLARHRSVQHSKLHGGRPKMPWIELRDRKVVPTLSSAQRLSAPPASPDDIAAHPFRTSAADGLVRAGRAA